MWTCRGCRGGVALQVFGVVTKTPRDLSHDRNTGETDNIRLLAMAQRWPSAAQTSLRAIAANGPRGSKVASVTWVRTHGPAA